MHTYDTCQDMRTHATICSPKEEAKKRRGGSPVDILGMWWARCRLYPIPVHEVEYFGEHLSAAKAGCSNS